MRVERRDLLQQLIDRKDNGRVKVVTGLWGCGKTCLLRKLQTENILYLALDQEANAALRNPVLLDQYLQDKIRVPREGGG